MKADRRFYNFIFTVLAILILVIDYFYTTEFNIESSFLILGLSLLCLNLLRLIFWTRFEHFKGGILVNLGLIVLLLYGIPELAYVSFGVGFTGRDIPIILGIAIITTIALIVILISDPF